MSSESSVILYPNEGFCSEYVQVTFDVLGRSYRYNCSDAIIFVQGLRASSTTEETQLCFTEVVASRSLVKMKLSDLSVDSTQKSCSMPIKFHHEVMMCSDKGPITSEQFLRMMQYQPGISNQVWVEYMRDCLRV